MSPARAGGGSRKGGSPEPGGGVEPDTVTEVLSANISPVSNRAIRIVNITQKWVENERLKGKNFKMYSIIFSVRISSLKTVIFTQRFG